MKCSDCQGELESTDFRGIKIDECARCKGRWFDRGELRKAKDKTDEDLRWLDFDPFSDDAGQFTVSGEGKACPGCSKIMSSLAYEKSGVIINKCLACEGVWLHHGEFEKIIRYLENLVVTESAAGYVKDSFKKFLEIATGSKKVTAEIKDFIVVLKLLEQRFGIEHPNIAAATNKIYQYLPFI